MIVLGVILEDKKFKVRTWAEVDHVIAQWLRQAPTRLKNKLRKSNDLQEDANNNEVITSHFPLPESEAVVHLAAATQEN